MEHYSNFYTFQIASLANVPGNTVGVKLYNCAKLLVCTSEVKRKRYASHAASVVMVQQKMKAENVVSSAKWSKILYKIAF